jgi:hypothetical protein
MATIFKMAGKLVAVRFNFYLQKFLEQKFSLWSIFPAWQTFGSFEKIEMLDLLQF